MPVLDIGGQRVNVGDEFLKLSPEQQQATVEEIAGSLKPKAATPVGVNDLVRSAATGVPILGGLANKANAATNAALAPLIEPFLSKGPETLDQPTFGERYNKSLALQEGRDTKFATEHPIVDTAAKVTGGVAGTIPLVMAAPAAFGIGGALPSQILRSAASGATLSGADAAVRGHDVVPAAALGGGLGAGAPLVAKGIGTVIDKFRPKPALVAQAVEQVGNTPVPLRPDQVAGDIPAAAEAEIILKGGRGESAQRVGQEFADQQGAALKKAQDEIAAGLDLTGAVARTAPHEAAEKVMDDVIARETTRLATERDALARTGLEGDRLRATVSGQVDASGAPVRTVDSPFAAAEVVGGGVQRAAQEARAARTEAYRDYGAVPGEYEPAGFTQVGTSIRNRLNAGNEPVRVTDSLTPRAAEALRSLDENVGTLRFQNNAETGQPILDAMGQPIRRPITGQTVEESRKELTMLYGDARRAAMAPGGSQADVRAMGRIVDAFDDHVRTLASSGGFSGDPQALLAAGERARASHAAYRQNFSKQGPGDEVGAAVEKIIGRYHGQAATPDEIATLSYGAASDPGGGSAARVAQRMRNIFGEASPEYGAYKQGLVSHVIDTPPGTVPRSATETANRIDKFLDGNKGKVLADIALSRGERDQLRSYAQTLRSSEPVPLSELKGADKIIARISGRDGGRPSTPQDVVDLLFSRSGKANKSESVLVAQKLKQDLTPEGWTAVRQGMWEKLTNAGEGKIPFEAQALSQRLHEFLHGSGKDMANTLFTAAERGEMAKLATVYERMIPPKGTANPSGTAPMLARMAAKGSANVLAMLGGVHSGFLGAAAGYGGAKLAQGAVNARNARSAVPMFYGQQPARAISSPRAPIVLSQAIAPQASNQ